MKPKKLFFKLTAVFISATMAFGLMTAAAGASAATVTPSGYITAYEEYVSQHMDALETLTNGLRNHESTISLRTNGVKSEDFHMLYHAVVHMNPELFYVGENFQYSLYYNGSTPYVANVYPYYTFTAGEVAQMMTAFDEKSEYFLSKVNENMSDFEKALILHDELILHSNYLLEGDTYTLMVDGTGKCEDYSRAYAFLLAQVGIKSEMIFSEVMCHQWLKVCIDGTYYHVDPTWDDPIVVEPNQYAQSGETRPNGYQGRAYHTNFLVSDSLIQSENFEMQHVYFDTYHESPSTYDNAQFRNIRSAFGYVDGDLYTMRYNSNDYTTQLVCYDPDDDTFQTVQFYDFYWSAGQQGFWVNSFSNLQVCDDILYFNGHDGVYTYDPATGQSLKYADDPAQNDIYGMYINNRTIYVYTAPDPNSLQDAWVIGTIEEPLPPLELGDVDQNGRVDICDCTMIQRYAATIESLDARQLVAADYDGDGSVTISDATAIQKAIAMIV
ncbi:MAG: dockerin type I domain-containing protein [Ruminococcus sp.]|nr:dockerin type I domain-containing protein [Ruminococcus sp.]